MSNILQNYQSILFPYAYNVLGSIDDANDVIQDVVANYIESNREAIENESAYLIKSVINKSINLKKRNKKIVLGLNQTVWLPEPVTTENTDAGINSKEITSYSMLVLLEYLKPKERAVFILKQAFDYSHQEIAELFSISVEHSRKLLSRAKNSLKEQDYEFKLKSASSYEFLSEYVDIIRKGDVNTLEEMLSEHITAQTDGGGKIKILSELTSGIKAVSGLIVKVFDLYLKKCRIEFKQLNHTSALLFYKGDSLMSCHILDIDADTVKINNIYSIVDPNKLKSI